REAAPFCLRSEDTFPLNLHSFEVPHAPQARFTPPGYFSYGSATPMRGKSLTSERSILNVRSETA
ncbi:MAG TPA: hypothetical protein VFU37_21660, partial [Pyrinomonadaceae bacterium]|nr:hypothetical protein [Pyrinomonadaceae bacterium]